MEYVYYIYSNTKWKKFNAEKQEICSVKNVADDPEQVRIFYHAGGGNLSRHSPATCLAHFKDENNELGTALTKENFLPWSVGGDNTGGMLSAAIKKFWCNPESASLEKLKKAWDKGEADREKYVKREREARLSPVFSVIAAVENPPEFWSVPNEEEVKEIIKKSVNEARDVR